MVAEDCTKDPSRRQVLGAGAAIVTVPGLLTGCGPGGAAVGDDTGVPGGTGDTGMAVDTGPSVDTGMPDLPPEPVRFDADALPLDEVFFDWSVQAGAMTKTEAVLITKVEIKRQVVVRVWVETEVRDQVILLVDGVVDVGDGGFVRARVTGLLPGRVHHYGFFDLDSGGALRARSLLGRFKTAPADDSLAPLVLNVQACNGGATGPDDAMGRVAELEPDLVVHLGDIAYNDGASSVGEYRRSWQDWMQSPGYKRGLAAAGWYATWDDHEVDNNWNPETTSQAQKAAALQAFVENVAVETGQDGRLWRSYRWGATAEIFLLDCRSERRPSTIANSDKDDDVYISPAQMDWLKAGLRDSPAVFKIVMTSVPITLMPWVGIEADDRWEGYPGQRSELLGFIRDEDLAHVYFLGGDFHINFVGSVQRSGVGRLAYTYEIAVTAGNINPAALVLRRPQFVYSRFEPRANTITFDPATRQVTARFYDPQDGSLDREVVLQQPEELPS